MSPDVQRYASYLDEVPQNPYGWMPTHYVDQIKNIEGFAPRAAWDYKQHTNGYGTRAQYPGEVIDKQTAEQRLQRELATAQSYVDRIAPNAPIGVKSALASLTFNAGSGWMNSGLGQAIKSGDWDAARDRFLQYTKADGAQLPGLVSRRQQEASWFSNPPVGPYEPDKSMLMPQGSAETGAGWRDSPPLQTARMQTPESYQDNFRTPQWDIDGGVTWSDGTKQKLYGGF